MHKALAKDQYEDRNRAAPDPREWRVWRSVRDDGRLGAWWATRRRPRPPSRMVRGESLTLVADSFDELLAEVEKEPQRDGARPSSD